MIVKPKEPENKTATVSPKASSEKSMTIIQEEDMEETIQQNNPSIQYSNNNNELVSITKSQKKTIPTNESP